VHEHHLYDIEIDPSEDGWRFRIAGTRPVRERGGFASHDDAVWGVHRELLRWRRRAKERGGWLWRPSGRQVAVALPAGERAEGALPMEHKPCSHHLRSS